MNQQQHWIFFRFVEVWRAHDEFFYLRSVGAGVPEGLHLRNIELRENGAVVMRQFANAVPVNRRNKNLWRKFQAAARKRDRVAIVADLEFAVVAVRENLGRRVSARDANRVDRHLAFFFRLKINRLAVGRPIRSRNVFIKLFGQVDMFSRSTLVNE